MPISDKEFLKEKFVNFIKYLNESFPNHVEVLKRLESSDERALAAYCITKVKPNKNNLDAFVSTFVAEYGIDPATVSNEVRGKIVRYLNCFLDVIDDIQI